MRRGLSEAVALAIVAAIMLTALVAFVLAMPRPPTAPVTREVSTYLSSFTVPNVYLAPISSGAVLMNRGSIPVTIKYLVVEINDSVEMVRDTGSNSFGEVCNATSTYLAPGSTVVLSCVEGAKVVAVVTSDGRIISISPRLYARVPAPQAINQIPILNITTTYTLSQYLLPSTNLTSPIVEIVNTTKLLNSSYIPLNLVLALNSSGQIALDLYASWIFIAYTPGSNGSELSMLITGIATSTHPFTAHVGSETLTLGTHVTRFRVKIVGLDIATSLIEINGVNIESPGIYPCGFESDGFCHVVVEGYAREIEVYTNSSRGGLTAVLDPYILVGDLLGDGHTGILFVTEDFSYGNRSVVDDQYVDPPPGPGPQPPPPAPRGAGGSSKPRRMFFTMIERLSRPLIIVFRDLPINNSKIATAIVSVRFLYWDNAKDSTLDCDNMPILRVGLYDPQSHRILYSVSFSYYDLCRLRGVYPPTWALAVRNALLYIPPPSLVGGSRIYYVALEIDDPFGLSPQGDEIRNDADLLIYIDYVGVVLSQRWWS